jgi:hypothetical protein
MTKTTTPALTLTTDEIVRATGLWPQHLNKWVQSGLVKPVRRGRRGPGNSDLYSPQQAVTLAVLSVTIKNWGSAPAGFVKQQMTSAERVTDQEMQSWLDAKADPWGEENTAAAFAKRCVPADPDAEESKLFWEAIGAMLEVIRAKWAATSRGGTTVAAKKRSTIK